MRILELLPLGIFENVETERDLLALQVLPLKAKEDEIKKLIKKRRLKAKERKLDRVLRKLNS